MVWFWYNSCGHDTVFPHEGMGMNDPLRMFLPVSLGSASLDIPVLKVEKRIASPKGLISATRQPH